jgi:UDP-GlcNAc:undecaprenyl-phosphate GlcNAc-1-phosphate transferase
LVDNISSLTGIGFTLIASFLISFTGTGLSIPLARKFHILDEPGDYKVQSAAIPRFGGLGIVLGVVITSAVLNECSPWLLIGAAAIALTGAIDDRFTISPLYKVFGQLISGLFLSIYVWTGSLSGREILLAVLAIFLVLGLSNAVNLIDGLNGLAAGTSLISISGLAFLISTQEKTPVMALIIIGALAGFLVWNFPKARTFMGDTGSLFTGYIIAALLVELATEGFFIFMIGILMVGIPVFDTSLGIVRRVVNKRPLFEADRGHFYDIMDQRIKNSTRTVLIIFAMNLFLVLGGVLAFLTGYIGAIVIYSLAIVSLIAMSRALAFVK